uniref:Uncharacterized protein n=1 Tax=Rhizophora mucronata TaxID=61149 RepID=A0A2P2MRD2_RHIMU
MLAVHTESIEYINLKSFEYLKQHNKIKICSNFRPSYNMLICKLSFNVHRIELRV